MHQVGKRCHVEAEFRTGYVRQQLRTGFIFGLVEFVSAAIVPEMFSVGGRKKSALVMVKPPGHARRAGIFKIDDGVFVAIKQSRLERLPCAVRHPPKMQFRYREDSLA